MDGWITIGTELNTNDFDKQLEKTQRKLQQLKKEEEKLNLKKQSAEINLNPYQNELKELKQLIAESEKLNMTAEQRKYEDYIHQGMLDQINLKYKKQIDNLNNINKKLKQNKGEQKLLTNQVEELNNKLQLQGISESLENIGKSTSKTVKQVGKWALAIFGVRAAYGFVRNAVSTLSQYNEQLAKDLEYIRFAIASSLEPLIEKIVSLVYKLLNYLNYIAQAWFGVNLFANASADAMNKSAKSAEKMKKSLTGFDEMNVLQDTSTSGTGGATVPSVDLSQWQGEVPSWIQWIADNKDIVIAGLLGIAGGLVAINLGLKPIRALGIGVALAGIIFAIQNLIKFLQDPTFENFTKIIIGIGIAILGVGIIIKSFPLIIAGVIIAIVGLIIKNYDFIIGLFDKLINWFETDFVNALHNLFGPIGDIIAQPFIFAINYLKGRFEGFYGGIKKVVTGIVQLFNGDFKNGIKNVFGGLKDILLAPLNSLIAGINSLIRGVNKISFDVPDWVPLLGGKKWGFNIPQIPKLAVGGIVNMPGRGVPVGGAIGGEAGREGVIPLTDSQAMEELGSAIGRYITINLTNNTNLDGRTIARQQSKVQANKNFAMNR